MEKLEVFLGQLNSNYPLNIISPSLCISLANSGRRGNAKEFYITLESFVSSLNNIKDNLSSFTASYDESAWRTGSDLFFTDNHAKSLCGVQTRPFFETVNKFVSWANESTYTEGHFSLTSESIEKTLYEINNQCQKNVLHYPLFEESSFAKLNEDQIVNILADKLTKERESPRGAQYFGFKYAQFLDSHTSIISKILEKAGVENSIAAEIVKGRGVFNRALEDGVVVKWYCPNNFTQSVENSKQTGSENGNAAADKNLVAVKFTPFQTIFYGVPGCGKSHTVDKIINSVIANFNKGKNSENQITYDKQVIRTVFHPDYCNADFVGQIMPKKKVDGIDYEFKPGPLATIIRKAYLNPSKPYFLIIEEINRGNASAIFGETFQLLDRYKNGKHSSQEDIRNENYDYTEGWSKYSINNDDLNGYILHGGEASVTEKEPGVEYDSDSSEAQKSAIKIPSIGLHFSTYSGIRLPPNLSLYATMNTSDQNVFTLDNAFQRRWEMKLISIDLKNDDEYPDEKAQYNQEIGDTGVKWGAFRDEINKIIMQSAEENGLSSMEDKRLGGWFITPKKNPEAGENAQPVITKKAFAEKVLKYLWDDAFKFDRKSHFDNSYITLEDLINAFVSGQDFNVFTDKAINELKPKSPTDATAATES